LSLAVSCPMKENVKGNISPHQEEGAIFCVHDIQLYIFIGSPACPAEHPDFISDMSNLWNKASHNSWGQNPFET
jgi:hypothetical protein